MAPLDTGRYIITNSRFKNVVYLPDANSCSDLLGDWHKDRPGQMWNLVLLRNGNYTIKNYDYSSYASCEFIVKPDVGNNIVGGDHEQQWKIIEEPEDGNSYVICPTKNGHVCWYLADGESGTPITLERYSQTNKVQWDFSQVEDAEGSGAVGGGETGRVRRHDDAPSTPVLVPTPVRVPTPPAIRMCGSFSALRPSPVGVRGNDRPSFPVLVPTPDLPILASASSLTSESLIVPGNYYTIGVAGTDQYLTLMHGNTNEVCANTPALGAQPHRWLITKCRDNWHIELLTGIYLQIRNYGKAYACLARPGTELSLTPVGGANEFRITDMESGQAWNGLVQFHVPTPPARSFSALRPSPVRVRGNDSPSFPVQVTTPVQVPTPVRVPTPPAIRKCGSALRPSPVGVRGNDRPSFPVLVPTPDLPTLASASSLTSGSYYIGVAGTDQYLTPMHSMHGSTSVCATTPAPGAQAQRWSITKFGDNWYFTLAGGYLQIRNYGQAYIFWARTELSLTPVGGANEFRITDMESGHALNDLVQFYKA